MLLANVEPAIDHAVRMAFCGRSTVRGRRPRWLERAADIRLVDIGGHDETILTFEAPRFGEAAGELYEQAEFWPTRPEPGETGFDVLARVVDHVRLRERDSDRYDRPLLRQVSLFKRALTNGFESLTMPRATPTTADAVIDMTVVNAATELGRATPASQRVRIVGHLDMVRRSTQTFGLLIGEAAEEVRGILPGGDIAELAAHLGKDVLVEGRVSFRPSGRVLCIEAEAFGSAANSPAIWKRLPEALGVSLDMRALRVAQGTSTGVSAFFGTWPGQETDAELLAELEQLG